MKSKTYFVVALFLFSSFAVVGMGNEAGELKQTITNNFLEPKILEGEYIELEVLYAKDLVLSIPIDVVYLERDIAGGHSRVRIGTRLAELP